MDDQERTDEVELDGTETEGGAAAEDEAANGSPENDRGPWGPLSDLQAAVGDLMDTALRGVAPGGARFPRYDLVSVPGEGYRVLMDLPGLEKGDIGLKIAARELTVSGERGRPELPEGSEMARSERAYGRFRRTVRLPEDVDADGIQARMTNGVLQVTLPVRQAEARDIEVE